MSKIMAYKRQKSIIFAYIKIIIVLIIIIIAATEAYFYFYLNDFIHMQKIPVSITPSMLLLESINISVKTDDGYELKGWLLPNNKSDKIILMLPGFNSNKGELLNLGSKIFALGYSVLLIDLRAMGESDGDKTYLGIKEKEDIKAIIKYILNENRIKISEIGIWADNLSAYSAVYSIQKFPQVKLLLLNNIYPNPLFFLRKNLKLPFSIPERISDFFIYQNLKYTIDYNPTETDITSILPTFQERATIFFQTNSSSYDYIKDLYKITPERKELIQLPKVGVEALKASDWESYYTIIKEKLNNFFGISQASTTIIQAK